MIRLPRMLSYVVLAGSLTLPAPLALYAQEADDAAAQEKAADEKAAVEEKPDAAAEPADAAAEPAAQEEPATDAPAEESAMEDEKPATEAPAEEPGTEATEAPAEGEEAKPAPVEPSQPAERGLVDTVDNFWHYTMIARYDLATAAGNRILNAGAKPEEVLKAFEEVAARRGRTRGGAAESIDAAMLRWQAIEPLKDVSTKLSQLINQGYGTRRGDQQFIEDTIKRLGGGRRGYENALQILRESGEYSVPLMLRYLRDPKQQELHAPIRDALRDFGRTSLSPLVAATDARDVRVLIPVLTVLGDIGYDVAVPYIIKAGTEPNAPNSVRVAADRALAKLNFNGANANPSDLFYELGEKFYYDTAAISADKRPKQTPVWVWDERRGLMPQEVPTAIFNEVMAMKAAETALGIGEGQGDAASLWLAANNKREAEMPEGGADPVYATRPPAHYYNVSLGVERLNNVLARALRDRNSAVALKAVRSAQSVVGQSNLFQGGQRGNAPLIDALRFPDRTVRYEAAMAIAASLPQQPFNDQQRVAPLLAEAVAQSGKPNILLVVSNEAERGRLAGELKGYNTAGGVGAGGALAEVGALPSVDVILVAADVNDQEVQNVVRQAAENARLERTPKLILRNRGGGEWARRAINDNTISVARGVNGGEGLLKAIEDARSRSGGLPLDEKVASDFALRAAQLLSRLAISRGQVLDLGPVLPTLLGALADPRADVAKAVGDAVALIESPQVQPALLQRAQEAQTPEDVRQSLYRSLATSAKFHGNQLQERQVADLRQTVQAEQNADIRAAAAEALGALNVPVQNVAQLITEGPQPAGGGQEAQPEDAPAANAR